MLNKSILCVIALAVSCLRAEVEAGPVIQDTSYNEVKKLLVDNGYTVNRADCFVKFFKNTGLTIDVSDRIISNRTELNEMWEKVNANAKAEIANFFCSPFGIIVIVLIFCFYFGILCICCIVPTAMYLFGW